MPKNNLSQFLKKVENKNSKNRFSSNEVNDTLKTVNLDENVLNSSSYEDPNSDKSILISNSNSNDDFLINSTMDAYESPRKIKKQESTSLSSIEEHILEWTVSNDKVQSDNSKTIKNEIVLCKDNEINLFDKNTKLESRYEFLIEIKDKNGRSISDKDYDNSTLFISKHQLDKLTLFEQQFWKIKKEYWDTVVFFKKGKFYELYENDADIASKLFNFRITDRVNMRMAGFPESTLDDWIRKFLDAGYKVARVDQVENMVAKKIREKGCQKDKIINRELKEIITQGTIYDLNHLKNNNSVYTLSIRENRFCVINNCTMVLHFSIILFDASTLEIFYKTFCDDSFYNNLKNIFVKYNIKEYISKKKYNFSATYNKADETILCKKFELFTEDENQCFSFLYNYLKYLKRENILSRCRYKQLEEIETRMIIDSSTINNMDLVSEIHTKTLFNAINYCNTPFGERKLKNWMLSPLNSITRIKERQNMTKILDNINLLEIIADLKLLGDLERLFSKLKSGNSKTKDLKLFLDKLDIVIRIYTNIENQFSDINSKNVSVIDSFDYILNLKPGSNIKFIFIKDLTAFLNDFENNYYISKDEIYPGKLNQGELSSLIEEKDKLIGHFDKYLLDQKEICRNTSINYKNVGKEIYQLDIPKNVSVPSEYYLVSATKTNNRYYTSKLKTLISEFIDLEEKIFQSQGSLLNKAVEYFLKSELILFKIINDLSNIDCLISFSLFNKQICGCIPNILNNIDILEMGNPIYKDYVTNDYIEENNILILTGSNMAGKSTFMRSFCLNVILYQMGMNVLATKFTCPIFDKVFSRIGASDNLIRGESTFMVELLETSHILKNATSNSLVIMDELGRGTSTKDGECIASSVLRKLKSIGCKLFFSTHYHKLFSGNIEYSLGYMNTKVQEKEVIFLYKLVKGICDDSNGIYVAKLAGVPFEIIQAAEKYKKLFLKNKKQ